MWVFGYGSLLWNPGFDPVQAEPACLQGYARSFCMWSIHHRGSPDDPGLVLALDAKRTARCDGMALRASQDDAPAILAMLRARELVSSAYVERILPVTLASGETVQAVSYVIDPDHEQYCKLSLERQAQVIACAVGGRGPNTEYLWNTVAYMRQIGICDPDLEWLDLRVRDIVG